MKNQYKSKPIKILHISDLSHNTKLFQLDIKLRFKPGQFVIAGLPGFGEAAFSIPAHNELAIRKAGTLTTALHNLKSGDFLWIRSTYGKGHWPNIKTPILIIAGGCGIISMRPLLTRDNIIIFYGVKSEKDLLFKNEHSTWSNLHISVEPVMITDLFDRIKLPKNLTAFLCGPPIMYKFVIAKLKKLKIPNNKIFTSLERRMSCGTGVCQHCAIGTKYVCKQGPVFSLAELTGQVF
ncbi:hypothetical protein CL633_00725 [bacterium]|nr:hypothetical protein [bacterium]|tara:strand:- start:1263 stop:1970 length:708 start_codon:yes stop_codon:yes gene_type:complete